MSVTPVVLFIYFESIFAGIVTNFSELKNFPSANLKTVSLFLSVTFTLLSLVNESMWLLSHVLPHATLVHPLSSTASLKFHLQILYCNVQMFLEKVKLH